MKKYLIITFKGNEYTIDTLGRISIDNITPTEDWRYLGSSTDALSKKIEIPIGVAFEDPDSLVGKTFWAWDKGKYYAWNCRMGHAYHKPARITKAYVKIES